MTRQVFVWAIVIGLAVGVCLAQTGPAIQPNTEQQQLVQAAVEAESITARDLQVAAANHRAAQAKTMQVIYQVMAEMKLSPTEYTWTGANGKLVFVKLPEKKDKP